MRFLDTNVLVYAASSQDERKRQIAIRLLRHALEENHDGVISLQILQEFTNVMLKRSLATDEQIERYYSYFYRLVGTEVTSDMLREAIKIRREYGIQYHDAVMIAAAKKVGCHEIVTEDLNDGQIYCGMVAVNPFKAVARSLVQREAAVAMSANPPLT